MRADSADIKNKEEGTEGMHTADALSTPLCSVCLCEQTTCASSYSYRFEDLVGIASYHESSESRSGDCKQTGYR
ncbi:hypothetical protein BaRGS_00027534 [Batillaria attramentaria]|uniref:Uncharacterized protein n=1 Tax=Batillaria attramentaria TaxID=370345 RepID=A0ABD0K2J6_9CAEN